MNNELKGLHEMFGLEDEGKVVGEHAEEQIVENNVVEIGINQLIDYRKGNLGENRYSDKDMDDLVMSVKENGIIQPIVVRPIGNDQYEIILGHHRRDAALLSNLATLPCIIREMDDSTAELVFMESNIQHGFENMLHSEKAELIYRRNEALKAQGKRTDLMEEKEKHQTAKDEFHLSGTTIKRYLRIYKLEDELKSLLDKGVIAIRTAVNLSYLSKEYQEYLAKYVGDGKRITDQKSEELKNLYKEGKLTKASFEEILEEKEKKKNSSNRKNYKINRKIFTKFFKDTQEENEIDEIIEKALSLYFGMEE